MSQNFGKYTPTDPNLVAQFGHAAGYALEQGGDKPAPGLDRYTMTAITSNRQGGVSRAPIGIGFLQSPMVSSEILPPVNATPDGNELAYFPVFKKEHFVVPANDTVAIGGNVLTSDVEFSFDSMTLTVHAHEVLAEPRELRIAAANGVDLASIKYDMAKAKVELYREQAAATLLTTTSNYNGGTNHTALTSGGTGTMWSNYAASGGVYYSNPLTNIFDKMESIRLSSGVRPNTLLITAPVWRALKQHPVILALIAYAGQKIGTPAAPATLETLSAIFGLNIIVAEALTASSPTATAFTDLWGKNAILAYVGPASLYAPQFGNTFQSSGYPKTLQGFDPKKGAEGSQTYRYIDAYGFKLHMSGAAGWLFDGCVA
jgi:hypothetical protein